MKSPFSTLSFIFISFIFFISGYFYYPKWKFEKTEAVISWDVSGYYWYLPATFIYKDLATMESAPMILEKYNPTPDFQQAYKGENGNFIFKYSSGLSLSMTPAFFTAHLLAESFGYAKDGFSRPYQLALWIWGLTISLIGLWILKNLLLIRFSDTASGLTLISIALGSNFFEYASITNAMTHNYLFFLYTLLILFTIRFYKTPGHLYAILIGLICGLMTLIRPTELISIIIPIFWGISLTKSSLIERFSFLWKKKSFLFFSVISFVLIAGIQLIYWKYVSGQWLVYSYQDQGFSWLKPHLIDGLFSARAGWLIYSPIMIISLVGFYYLKKHTEYLWVMIVFSIIFIYITFAWDIWWYGGSLGQRALIQLYPVLAFPMAAFYEKFNRKPKYLIFISIFILWGVMHNIWLSHIAHRGGLLRAGEMSKAYFWAIYLKKEVREDILKLLDTKYIYHKELNNPVTLLPANQDSTLSLFCLDGNIQFSQIHSIDLTAYTEGWLRASAQFTTEDKEWETWRMTQLIIKYYNGDKNIDSDMIRIQRLLNAHERKLIYLDSKVPANATKAELFLWNSESNKVVCFDNLQLIYHKS
ncbi:MAG: hypothetical protein IPM42_18780 [Saprospiraceae bacterium]|nr:hypothetical protein [Saprospiraceae bacterium]